MMIDFIQSLANRLGYNISRLSGPRSPDDAWSALQRLLAGIEKPVIFDVGAHHGYVSLTFRQLFPSATIYAFEPFPESFKRLKANTASDPKIHAFNYGLSDQEGMQPFYSNQSSATNSLLSTDASGKDTWGAGLLETRRRISAPFKTLDSVMDSLEIPGIDLLKLDVQGAEHLVMSGASATLDRGHIRLIYTEIITQPTYANQKRFDEALAVFYRANFDLYHLYNMSLTREGRLRQVDAIFTRNASVEGDR